MMKFQVAKDRIKRGIVFLVLPLFILNPGSYAAEISEQTNGLPVPVISVSGVIPEAPPDTKTPAPKTTTDFFLNDAPLSLATPAASYYVSPAGSDAADGSLAAPWHSIQSAANRLAPGDTLYLLEGTYEEYVVLNISGAAGSPITIEGIGQVTLDAVNLTYPNPDFPQEILRRDIFDTGGQDYLQFRNLKVLNAGIGIRVSAGSDSVLIDGLKTDDTRYGVYMTDASNVTVLNSEVLNSRYGFYATGTSHDLLLENVASYFSKDNYANLDIHYINGDGFTFEAQTSNITVRNAVSAHHWDSGFDIKGSNVLVENAIAFGNKNGFKTWGQNITIRNSLVYNSLSQPRPDGTMIDGAGINLIQGTLNVENSTIADAQAENIIIHAPGALTLTNSIVARRQTGGLISNSGTMTANNNYWFRQGQAGAGFVLPAGDFYADPQFLDWDNFNYLLAASSPAAGLGASLPTATDPRTVPPPANGTILNGLISGQTVSGTIFVEFNLASGLEVSEIRYFMDGQASGREFTAPFRLGGSAGFDTQNLSPGSHVLTVLVLAKDQNILPFLVPFQVSQPAPTGDFVGVTGGATVNGIVTIGPNLTVHPGVRKVAYYLNGTKSGKVYQTPFYWGGPLGNGTQGFDTRTLADGTYTLGAAFTTSTGDQSYAVTFTVNNSVADTTAPVISAVASSNISSSGATVTWSTDEPSDSQVEYRVQGTANWSATSISTALVTNHSTALTGLIANTLYEYRVKSKDAFNNLATQVTISTLTTAAPDTTPPVISAVISSNITSAGATITWTTNEASDSQVQYRVQGTTPWLNTTLNTSLVISHSVTLSGLNASTTYQYQVKSNDPAGNLATQTTISSLTTPVAPATGDFAGVTGGATVSGIVNIGPNLTLHPSVRKVAYYLNGTQSGKVYASPYLWGGPTGNGTTGFDTRILADGNYTLSMGYTDSTGDHSASVSFIVNNATGDTTPPVISAVASGNVTSSGATISWSTNEPGDSQVQYRVQGTTPWLDTPLTTPLVTSHSVTLTGLNASTVYEYQVKSKDVAGNLATQATISSLTTTTSNPGTAPTVSVTIPAEGATVPAGTIAVDFDVQNFTIGGPGEPHVRFFIDNDPEPYEFYNGTIQEVWYRGVHTHFTHWHDSSSIEVFALAAGTHQIRFEAVDANGTPLPNPEAIQTLSFTVDASGATAFSLQPVATGLEFPASITFDPSGRVFYNELLTGNIRLMDPGFVLRPTPFYHLNIQTGTDRGLLGIELDPDFQVNHFVYVYYSDADNTNKVVRLTEVNGVGTDFTVILGDLPANPGHNGGNIHFGPDGKLYISLGDFTDSVASQDLGSLKGKILRINKDGTIPADNPFVGQVGARSEIWAYGLRNSFDFTFHPITGDLWATENGPDQDDEINRIVRGGNYGWPIVTGIAGDPRFIDPIIEITPTISPTGIVPISRNSPYESLYHDRLFFAEFNTGVVKSVTLAGANLDQFGAVETIYGGGQGGILDLMPGPDGMIYAATLDGLFRIQPGTGDHSDPNAPILGISQGEVVSGTVRIFPNVALIQHVKKVAYYLNGSQSGKYYELPFMWGGLEGFDTRTLANGTYTLAGSITSQADGEHPFSVTFTVAN